jgi:acyl-CoA thioester hydrolase
VSQNNSARANHSGKAEVDRPAARPTEMRRKKGNEERAWQKLTYELTVYTFQIDFAGHVSNIVYVQWMEIGRLLLLKAIGRPVERFVESGIAPILVETAITYKKPLRLGDTVRAEVWISELTKASAWMEFRFYNGAGELAASGRQRGIFIDLKSGKPKRFSDADRALFTHYVISEQPVPLHRRILTRSSSRSQT